MRRTSSCVWIGAVLACVAVVPCAARAEPVRAEPVPAAPYRLAYDVRVDVPLTLGLAALWITSDLLKDELAPSHARWTRVNAVDAHITHALRWTNLGRAAALSDWVGLRALPVLGLGSLTLAGYFAGNLQKSWVDALIVVEAVSAAALVNQAVKFSAGRRRPLAELTGDARAFGSDTDLSFYSGHTSMAFSVVVAAGTTAWLRGYRAAPYMFAAGLPLAFLTGYARIAAERHYFTDVLTGALAGSAIGALVPLLRHGRRPLPVSITASSSPAMLVVGYSR